MTDDSFTLQRTALFAMLEGVAASVDSTEALGKDSDGNRFNVDTDGDGEPDIYVPGQDDASDYTE